MATLKQVAERAGVSTATVSKVLSNTPYFTDETRQKVMLAVNELGYVPNLAARALSSGGSKIIAIVFPYVFDAVFTDPFVQAVLEGVERVCSQNGYHLLLSTPRLSDLGPDDNYIQLIRSGYVEGIIALDNVPMASVIEPAQKFNIPAVSLGYDQHETFIRNDDRMGGKLLANHLLTLGHRKIGLISTPEQLNNPVRERLMGIQDACSILDIDFETFPIAIGQFSVESGAQAAQDLLADDPDLTAIIALNDRMAMGAMGYISNSGRRIPADFSVVGYDNIPLSAYATPPLTTIDQHAPKLGEQAAQMLFQMLNKENPHSVILSPELIIRESSAPPNKPIEGGDA